MSLQYYVPDGPSSGMSTFVAVESPKLRGGVCLLAMSRGAYEFDECASKV